MDSILQIAQVSLLIYLALLGTYFLPAYFKKKAENFAQSEDIQKLTTLVKEVEFSFEEKLQSMKSKLDLSSHFQSGLLDEERNSIIKFYSSLRQYYNVLIDLSFGGLDMENNEELRKFRIENYRLGDEALEYSEYLQLFLDHDEFEIQRKGKEIFSDLLDFTITYRAQIGNLISHNHKYFPTDNDESTAEFYKIAMKLDAEFATKVSKLISKVNVKFGDLAVSIRSHLQSRLV